MTDVALTSNAMVNALVAAREKLVLYRQAHSGEYIGGTEFTALIFQIDSAIGSREHAHETLGVDAEVARQIWAALDDLYALVRKQDMEPAFRGRIERALSVGRWEPRGSQKAVPQRPNVFAHGLTLSKTDVDDICGTGDLYGGKALLACGCIDICTNQRDHMPPAQSEREV